MYHFDYRLYYNRELLLLWRLETGKCVNVNEFEKYAATVEDIIATSTGNDFVTFEIKDIVPIVVAKKYAGIGASLVARIKNTKTPFS